MHPLALVTRVCLLSVGLMIRGLARVPAILFFRMFTFEGSTFRVAMAVVAVAAGWERGELFLSMAFSQSKTALSRITEPWAATAAVPTAEVVEDCQAMAVICVPLVVVAVAVRGGTAAKGIVPEEYIKVVVAA